MRSRFFFKRERDGRGKEHVKRGEIEGEKGMEGEKRKKIARNRE